MIVASIHYAEWVTAIGTVSATVAALSIAIGVQWWQDRSRARRIPTLTLESDDAWFFGNQGWHRLRLAVRNGLGKAAARDVLVNVERIEWGGGTYDRPLNTALPWSNNYDRRLSPMTIPAGEVRHVDLGEFVDNHDRDAMSAPTFKVAGRALQPQPFTFHLSVSAENCDPTKWLVQVVVPKPVDGDPKKPAGTSMTVERLAPSRTS